MFLCFLFLGVIAFFFYLSITHNSDLCFFHVLQALYCQAWLEDLGFDFLMFLVLPSLISKSFFLNDDYSTRMLALFTDKYLREITLCLSFSDNTRTSYLSSFHKQLRTRKRKLLFYEMFIVYRNREFFCLKIVFL